MHKSPRHLLASIAAAILALSTASCGKSEKTPATQVAAKVNSEEISIHQLNHIITRANATASTPEQMQRIRKGLLERLIDQQLLIDLAVAKKLDRSPEIMMAIDAAKRDILARAYLEQIATAQPKPATEEVQKYIAENPALFAERRVYALQEIMLPQTEGIAGQLREMIAAGKSMEEVAKWLGGKAIKFAGGSTSRTAEQIPLELLSKLHALKDGQGLVTESEQGITAIRLVNSQAAPVTGEAASTRVQQFLTNQRATKTAEEEIKKAREKAKIVYVGEFANSTPDQQMKAAPLPANTTSFDKAIDKAAAGLK